MVAGWWGGGTIIDANHQLKANSCRCHLLAAQKVLIELRPRDRLRLWLGARLALLHPQWCMRPGRVGREGGGMQHQLPNFMPNVVADISIFSNLNFLFRQNVDTACWLVGWSRTLWRADIVYQATLWTPHRFHFPQLVKKITHMCGFSSGFVEEAGKMRTQSLRLAACVKFENTLMSGWIWALLWCVPFCQEISSWLRQDTAQGWGTCWEFLGNKQLSSYKTSIQWVNWVHI